MEEQGFVEGEDWDFWFYLDGKKVFGPLCPEGVSKCWEEGDPEPIEEYVVYNTAGKKGQRVSKERYIAFSNSTD